MQLSRSRVDSASAATEDNRDEQEELTIEDDDGDDDGNESFFSASDGRLSDHVSESEDIRPSALYRSAKDGGRSDECADEDNVNILLPRNANSCGGGPGVTEDEAESSNEIRSMATRDREAPAITIDLADGNDTTSSPSGMVEVGHGNDARIAPREERQSDDLVGSRPRSRATNDRAATAGVDDYGSTFAYFAAVSVSDLRQVEGLDTLARRAVIRVSDQHGSRIETASRVLPQGGGKARCMTWCEELQMPISDDVDGVLFELLLLSAHSLPDEKRSPSSSGQNEKIADNRRCYHHQAQPRVPEDYKQETVTVVVSTDGSYAVDANINPGAAGNVSGGIVGAVALLLSDVANRWRTMESPLFDSAGSVVGTMKMAARILGGGDGKTGERAESLGRSAAVAYMSPMEHVPKHVAERKNDACLRQSVQDCRRHQNSTQTPTRGKYDGGGGGGGHGDGGGSGLRPRLGYESLGNTLGASLPGTETTVIEERPLTRDFERVPRAAIIYRGVRLPYRWFRSSSAASMDQALREALGIKASAPTPRLYDVSTGARLYLEPHTPSGLTLMAILAEEDSANGAEDAVGRSSSARPSDATPKQPSTSSFFQKCRDQAHGDAVDAADRASTATLLRENSLGSNKRPGVTSGGVANDVPVQLTDFPEEDIATIRTRSILRPAIGAFAAAPAAPKSVEESPVECKLEEQREQELKAAEEREKAARVACCKLVRRVLLGAARRALLAAFWRWRSLAATWRIVDEGKEERRRDAQQTVALLDRLRGEVASLASASHEGLLAVSTDALERDLAGRGFEAHTVLRGSPPGGEVGSSVLGDSLGYNSTVTVDQVVDALEVDILRLSAVRAEERQCLAHRLREASAIKNAAAFLAHTTATASTATATAVDLQIPPATPRMPPRTTKQFSSISDSRFSASCGWNPTEERRPDVRGKEGRHRRRRQPLMVSNISSSGFHDCGDDEPLQSFLARYAKTFPIAAVVGDRCYLRRSIFQSQEPVQTDWGVRDSQKTAAVYDGAYCASEGHIGGDKWNFSTILWALFRIFADSPPFPENVFPAASITTSTPGIAATDATATVTTEHDRHDHGGPGGMSLAAFLNVCRKARMISAARVAWCAAERGHIGRFRGRTTRSKSVHGGGGMKGQRHDDRRCESVGDSGAEPTKTQLLDPVIAAKIFKRVVTRLLPLHRRTSPTRVRHFSRPRTTTAIPPPRKDDVYSGIPDFSPRRQRYFRGVVGRAAGILPRAAVSDDDGGTTVTDASDEGSPLHSCHGEHRGWEDRRRRGRRRRRCRSQERKRGRAGESANLRARESANLRPATVGTLHDGRRLLPGKTTSGQRYQQRPSSSVDRRGDILRNGRPSRPVASSIHERGEFSSFCRVKTAFSHLEEMKRRRRQQQHGCSTRRRRQGQYERLTFPQFCAAVQGLDNVYAEADGTVLGACGQEEEEEDGYSSVGEHGVGRDGRFNIRRGNGRSGRGGGVNITATSFVGSCLLRLAKALAMQQLVSRDTDAGETLGLLDPLVQRALEVNEQILLEIFKYYCNTNGGWKNRVAEKGSRPAPALSFEGGTAFARSFSVVPQVLNLQQLAELWKTSCWIQHTCGRATSLGYKTASSSLRPGHVSSARTAGKDNQRMNSHNNTTRTKTAPPTPPSPPAVADASNAQDCLGDHSVTSNPAVRGAFFTAEDEAVCPSHYSLDCGRDDGEASTFDDGNTEVDRQTEDSAAESQTRPSRVLGFAGFLDLLGRCAFRHARRIHGFDTTPGGRLVSSSSCSPFSAVGNPYETIDEISINRTHVDFRPFLSRHNPGQAMLAFLEALHVSNGVHSILSSKDVGGSGAVNRRVLERGFRRP